MFSSLGVEGRCEEETRKREKKKVVYGHTFNYLEIKERRR
jgi:hypothetical protein